MPKSTRSPLKMVTKLYPHQIEAKKWLSSLEEKGYGGILADEMGLGKTLTMISLIIEDHRDQKTLILVPKSILLQWKQEILTHTNMKEKYIYVYYGKNRTVPDDCRIVLSTYQTLVQDRKRKTTDTLFYISWHRVVIDESHSIRNKNTQLYKSVMKLKKDIGICMSGTPFYNYLKDIHAQIEFCNIPLPKYVSNYGDWLEHASKCNRKSLDEWRTKHIRRNDKSILTNMPKIEEHRILLTMNRKEFKAYRSAFELAHSSFQDWFTQKHRNITMYSEVLVQILRMRQACNHAGLSSMSMFRAGICAICGETIEDDVKNNNCCKDHMICNRCLPEKTKKCYMCKIDPKKPKNCNSTKIKKLFKILRKVKGKTVIFSQWTSMLDIIEAKINHMGLIYSRLDGSMSPMQREKQIKKFINKSDIFLVSLKAGGQGLNLACAKNVVLMDPWWNPFAEQQAIDRVHRIGQKHKKIHVYRLEQENTVEEWMNKLKNSKMSESKIIIGSCDFKTSSKSITKDDIPKLFNYVDSLFAELEEKVLEKAEKKVKNK